ncbi:CPBP family intramembrane glutamic endopeptidase [Alteribacillus bidgolensis]|uniref:CPBP family intramembrane glutamic endopeptidase n=1 Tax=Alteribacillus bidgolensis TaxID=930129 RepID=UPI000B86C072|nr:CPBP family intramembrane glutamic endopeptidase [Alteribacillus bidgolensis]
MEKSGADQLEEDKKLPNDITLTSVWKSFSLFVIIAMIIIIVFHGEGRLTYIKHLWLSDAVHIDIVVGGFIGVGFTGLIVLLYYLTNLSLPKNEYTRLIRKMLYKKFGIFTIAFGAGFSEEILFRGAILGLLIMYIGAAPALLIVSFIFMALHIPQYKGNIFIHVIVFGMGMILGGLFIWTEALWAPVAAHVTYNGLMARLMKKQDQAQTVT